MAEIKLTKNELREEQTRLAQLEKYLPTLQLKKAMLQAEVQEVRQQIVELEKNQEQRQQKVEAFSPLLVEEGLVDFSKAVTIKKVLKRYDNVAGVEIPYFEGVEFDVFSYSLFDTPPWIDQAILQMKEWIIAEKKMEIAKEQKEALEKEWREVSIRVNLFEKILIPRAIENIRVIKVFLGDQALAAVCRAKVAKKKIIQKQGYS